MRFSDKAIGLVLVAFGVAVLVHTRTFPSMDTGHPGPGFFPNVLAGLLIIAGIALVVQGVRSGERLLKLDKSGMTGSGLINILFALGAIVFYICLSGFLGFQITCFVLLVATMKWLRVSTLWTLVMACGVTFGIYVLFAKILLVPLPWGLWGW